MIIYKMFTRRVLLLLLLEPKAPIPRIVLISSKLQTFIRRGLATSWNMMQMWCQSLAFSYLNKFIETLKKFHTSGSSIVGAHNSTTNLCKFLCLARPRTNFSKITSPSLVWTDSSKQLENVTPARPYNSTTKFCKFQCPARPRTSFSKITHWSFKTNICSY